MEAYFSQQAGSEDNGNDTSLCRLGQKSNDGNTITPGTADDNSNQQCSILEKALAKQDQAIHFNVDNPIVVGSPSTGIPSGKGYADKMRYTYKQVLLKNNNIFIPKQIHLVPIVWLFLHLTSFS